MEIFDQYPGALVSTAPPHLAAVSAPSLPLCFHLPHKGLLLPRAITVTPEASTVWADAQGRTNRWPNGAGGQHRVFFLAAFRDFSPSVTLCRPSQGNLTPGPPDEAPIGRRGVALAHLRASVKASRAADTEGTRGSSLGRFSNLYHLSCDFTQSCVLACHPSLATLRAVCPT